MKGDFADRLRKLLRERGITQRQLSRNIGIGESQVNKYVCGLALPRADTLQRIENSLGVKKGTLRALIDAEDDDIDGTTHTMSSREEKILSVWNRGEKTAEEVANITGYPLRVVGLYLPIGIEKEYK